MGDASETRPEPAAAAPARVYRAELLVRFAHCDPAGIVFFPRYLEMFNNLVEDWCREELQLSFTEIHAGRGWGLPTVHLEVDFVAPSKLGDVLTATMTVRSVGTSSIGLNIVLRGSDGDDRVRGNVVLVLIDARLQRARAIPDDLRARIAAFQVDR
jgi:4-hydroxybenzoyl-CoA thioesterase